MSNENGDTSENGNVEVGSEERTAKRIKLDDDEPSYGGEVENIPQAQERVKGIAPIKKEYLVDVKQLSQAPAGVDDDAAEQAGKAQPEILGGRGGKKTKGGQNHSRRYGWSGDSIQLCKSRVHVREFAPSTCTFGDRCKYTHDLREYLKNGKREDLGTLGGKCPIFELKGSCSAGWKCRFARSHSKEVQDDDGRMELVLISKENNDNGVSGADEDTEDGLGVSNIISIGDRITLRKKQFPTKKADAYLKWLNDSMSQPNGNEDSSETQQLGPNGADVSEHRATYREAPLKASEKRRLYYGPETPVLAPLTTQGNLPFRRLCVSLGAEITWSEMAMGLPLLQGEKQEWALMRAHETELSPPRFEARTPILNYDVRKDLKFGVQIAANKPWLALKTTEVLAEVCPHLRAIDLNCGCPIDLVFRQGAGSALLDSHAKLEKILRGMNVVSKEVPITVKIRMGTKDKFPNADKLCRRLILGGEDAVTASEGPSGIAAITLHGRSRQQRYTRSADWEYIASCASLVQQLKIEQAEITDTIREPDARELPVTNGRAGPGLPYFIGNGDILSHEDWNRHITHANVDSCMIGRGALIKPWIFEEIVTGQYIDKSGSERLSLIEQFVRNGLEHWGSDEVGVGITRRFLLEWLSFSCRYVPIGILEHLPPRLGDRPPAFKGRDDKETLLSSPNYKDWIGISEQFLGPAHKDFHFEPKHKSNSYEIETQG